MSPLMAEIPEIVAPPPIIDRLVLHIWPTLPHLSLPPSLPPSPPLPSQCPSTPVRHSHESNDRNSRRRFLRRGYFGDAAQIGTQYRQRREEAGSPRKEGKEGRRTNVDDLSSSS